MHCSCQEFNYKWYSCTVTDSSLKHSLQLKARQLILQIWSLLNFSCNPKSPSVLLKCLNVYNNVDKFHFSFGGGSMRDLKKKKCWQTSRQKYAYYSKFHSSYWCYIFLFPLLTSSGIPRFWMNPCQTGLIRSHHRLSPPRRNPSHSSQRSPPHPFWALRISCAKLLICLVTSQCFLHGTEGKISTLLCAVNHSTPPLIHWYDHYSIRLHSNWPQFLVITVGGLAIVFTF